MGPIEHWGPAAVCVRPLHARPRACTGARIPGAAVAPACGCGGGGALFAGAAKRCTCPRRPGARAWLGVGVAGPGGVTVDSETPLYRDHGRGLRLLSPRPRLATLAGPARGHRVFIFSVPVISGLPVIVKWRSSRSNNPAAAIHTGKRIGVCESPRKELSHTSISMSKLEFAACCRAFEILDWRDWGLTGDFATTFFSNRYDN